MPPKHFIPADKHQLLLDMLAGWHEFVSERADTSPEYMYAQHIYNLYQAAGALIHDSPETWNAAAQKLLTDEIIPLFFESSKKEPVSFEVSELEVEF